MLKERQATKLWISIKIKNPLYWKDEALEKLARQEFYNELKHFEFSHLSETIKYVKTHLMRNNFDWPSIDDIKNVYRTLEIERNSAKSTIDFEEHKKRIDEQARQEAHDWWIKNGKPSVAQQKEMIKQLLRLKKMNIATRIAVDIPNKKKIKQELKNAYSDLKVPD